MHQGNINPALTKNEIALIQVLASIAPTMPSPILVDEDRLPILADWALYNDVFTQVLFNLEVLGQNGERQLQSQFRVVSTYPKFEIWKKTLAIHNEHLFLLINLLNSVNTPYTLIKSHNLQQYYGQSPRFQRDIDILLPNIDDGWKVISVLQKDGFVIEKIKLGLIDPCRNNGFKTTYYLLVNLSKIIESEPELNIDVHAGAFPICGSLAIYPEEIFTNIQPLYFEYDNRVTLIPSPSAENSILILIAHLCQHWLVTYRDINDLKAITYYGNKQLDWNSLFLALDKYGLNEIFQCLAQLANISIGEDILIGWGKKSRKYKCLLDIFSKRDYLRVLAERAYFLSRSNALLYNNGFQGTVNGLTDLFYLMVNNSPFYNPINNRPFKIYPNRVVQNLRQGSKQVRLEMLVVNPIPLNLIELSNKRYSRLTDTTIIFFENSETELIVCPIGILTQSGYSSLLTDNEKTKLVSLAKKLLSLSDNQ